jgi:hypothetical protein
MPNVNDRRRWCLSNAADCDLIASLAVDPIKRALFERLSKKFRQMADDIHAVCPAPEAKDAA